MWLTSMQRTGPNSLIVAPPSSVINARRLGCFRGVHGQRQQL
jgi:hypothetical protein